MSAFDGLSVSALCVRALCVQAPAQGRRAGQPAAANNVRGAIADEVVLQELAALRKQKANGSWHVVGLDSKLDAAILSADEHTAIGEL